MVVTVVDLSEHYCQQHRNRIGIVAIDPCREACCGGFVNMNLAVPIIGVAPVLAVTEVTCSYRMTCRMTVVIFRRALVLTLRVASLL